MVISFIFFFLSLFPFLSLTPFSSGYYHKIISCEILRKIDKYEDDVRQEQIRADAEMQKQAAEEAAKSAEEKSVEVPDEPM